MRDLEAVVVEDVADSSIQLPRNLMQYLNFAALSNLPLRQLTNTRETYRTFYKYTKEDVLKYVAAPDRYEKELRNASIYLYNACSYYHRVIDHFAKMPTFGYVIAPSKLDVTKAKPDRLRADYQKKAILLETMNIKDSFRGPLVVAMREDVAYYYVHETKDSFMLQRLESDYCKLSGKTDGVYDCAFDFRYFSGNNEYRLDMFPAEFTEKYRLYEQHGETMRWQQLDPRRTCVLKANYDLEYPIPPFAGAFEAIYDIIDYKSLQLAKTEVGNYKILNLVLPTNDKGDFLLDLDLATQFYNQIGQNLPENIGLSMSPMEMEDFDFERGATNSDTDMVRSAEKNFFSAAGVSTLLFDNEKASSNALIQSLRCDEAVVQGLISQIERWINRYLKYQTGTQKFHVVMPMLTVYNEKEKAEGFLKGAQSGMPTKMLYGAALGLSPTEMLAMNYMENDVFGLPDKLIPLQTSYTMSSSDTGRPTNESIGEPLSDAGEIAQERGE